MIKSIIRVMLAICLLGTVLFAQTPRRAAPRAGRGSRVQIKQGFINTTQTKENWEEINFEFNSAILTDGFPSLLRLAELMGKHPDYRVRLEGHTDYVGSVAYNERLALARANTVRDFLIKYGAPAGQIQTSGQGKRNPEVENRTKEGRFVNRRVVLTVIDGQGKVVSEGGVGEAIEGFKDFMKKQEECCSNILKRLDKLDEILAAMRDLKGENDKLRTDLADLKNEQQRLKEQVGGLPNRQETTAIARQEGDVTAGKAAAQAVAEAARRNRKFSLVGLNIGPALGAGRTGNFTFSGKGQFFSPFGGSGMRAVQAQGEYMYYRGRQEGQFDIGLVNRWSSIQAGLFSSFKYVNFSEFRAGATIAQAAFTFDYLFNGGKVGFFGTKGFRDNAVLSRAQLGPNSFNEIYLKIVDQVGASAQVGLFGSSYIEGNIAYLKRHARGLDDRPGAMARFVHPLNDNFALTVEAGLNETFLNTSDSGRVVFGFQFGNFIRPRDYASIRHPVPVDIPRIRYELLSRRVGNSAPIADAGPDQIGAAAGTITLNGSGSSDPDGDAITFLWEQTGGPSVSLSGANTARATFTAVAGQTYNFRLTVRDPGGLTGTARVTVSTSAATQVRILRFTAQPASIRAGQMATLTWDTDGADTVSITGLGSVPVRGSRQVSPTQTTMYQLTATGRSGSQTDTVSVVVERDDVRILRFDASPVNIMRGEASNLNWTTENADTVTISGLGNVPVNGSRAVNPTQTTSYVLTATGRSGSVTSTAVVQVGTGQAPRVIRFVATPMEITPGDQVTLTYQVENATDVTISGVGRVEPNGTSTVRPTANTTYTLTARNPQGEISVPLVVAVVPPVKILNFTADPATSASNGAVVTLRWSTTDATDVVITGVGSVPVNGTVQVRPTSNTVYTLLAYGRRGSPASADVLVNVPAATGGNRPPVADAGPPIRLYNNTVSLNGSRSYDPDGDPITFSWRFISGVGTSTLSGANTATPTAFMSGPFGDYLYELTVTDNKGASSTAVVRVTFDP